MKFHTICLYGFLGLTLTIINNNKNQVEAKLGKRSLVEVELSQSALEVEQERERQRGRMGDGDDGLLDGNGRRQDRKGLLNRGDEDPYTEFSFDDPLEFCVALLGNGYKFWAYTAAFARITEEVGSIKCATGGSSASIMTFFLESISINPTTHRCGRRLCTDTEKRQREALLWKSFNGIPVFDMTFNLYLVDILVDIFLYMMKYDNHWRLLRDKGYTDAFRGALARARENFKMAVGNAGLAFTAWRMLNFDELWTTVAMSPDPDFHLQDIRQSVKEAISMGGDFTTERFVRTAFINWKEIAYTWGRVASFFAGYGDYDHRGMDDWMETCAPKAVGGNWDNVRYQEGSNGRSNCGEEFLSLYNTHQQHFKRGKHTNRADDYIGAHLPVLVATSLVVGEGAANWDNAKVQYMSGSNVEFEPGFDSFRIGYFGKGSHLEKVYDHVVATYPHRLRTERFYPIAGATWAQVLYTSPAEPGLSPGVRVNEESISLGGWADPLRVNVAYGLGALRVIAIVARNDDQFFPRTAAKHVGATDKQLDALYSYDNSDSEILKELANATGVWCTDWLSIPPQAGGAVFDDAYNCPLLSNDTFFANVTNFNSTAEIRSCSGVAGVSIVM